MFISYGYNLLLLECWAELELREGNRIKAGKIARVRERMIERRRGYNSSIICRED